MYTTDPASPLRNAFTLSVKFVPFKPSLPVAPLSPALPASPACPLAALPSRPSAAVSPSLSNLFVTFSAKDKVMVPLLATVLIWSAVPATFKVPVANGKFK